MKFIEVTVYAFDTPNLFLTRKHALQQFQIMLPILSPALLAVALLTFNSAARNVANIAIIVTSDNRPLSILQIDYAREGKLEKATIIGTMVIVLTFGATILARLIARRFGFRAA